MKVHSLLLLLICCITFRCNAQQDRFSGRWALTFVEYKLQPEGCVFILTPKPGNKEYALHYTQHNCPDIVPSEGIYTVVDTNLVGNGITLTPSYISLMQYVHEIAVEYRPVVRDSIVSKYLELGARALDEAARDSTRKPALLRQAITFEKKGLQLDNRRIGCYYNLCIAYLSAGRTDSVALYYHKAMNVDARDTLLQKMKRPLSNQYMWDAWLKYGKYGRFKLAAKLLEKAVDIDERNAEAWSNLGGAFYSDKHYRKAVNAFERALELDPTLEDAEKGLEAVRAALESK